MSVEKDCLQDEIRSLRDERDALLATLHRAQDQAGKHAHVEQERDALKGKLDNLIESAKRACSVMSAHGFYVDGPLLLRAIESARAALRGEGEK